MSSATPLKLELRLENSIIAALKANPGTREYSGRGRDGDTPITPQSPAPPKPVIICVATDAGRYRLTPIRMLRAIIRIRANAKTQGGDAENFDALCGAVEAWMESTNLLEALAVPSAPDPVTGLIIPGIAIFNAKRAPGNQFGILGNIREQGYGLEVKAIGTERTIQG
jgi:hypothetical protein